MMSLLITGGCGFIGSHLVEACQEGEGEVRVLDDLTTGSRTNMTGMESMLFEHSIGNREALVEAATGVDCIFHLAAMANVPDSMERPGECFESNLMGLLSVLEAAVAAGVRKVIFASSAAIYGNGCGGPRREVEMPDPRSPYAISKMAGEQLLGFFEREHGLEAVSLRFFNVFGPRQNPSSSYAAAIPIFVEKALKGETITIHGDGEQTRDFVYVRDVARALIHVSRHPEARGVYNVGLGHAVSINSLVARILAITGSSSKVIYTEERVGDIRQSCSDSTKLRGLGWEPAYPLDRGLEETVGWWAGRLGGTLRD